MLLIPSAPFDRNITININHIICQSRKASKKS